MSFFSSALNFGTSLVGAFSGGGGDGKGNKALANTLTQSDRATRASIREGFTAQRARSLLESSIKKGTSDQNRITGRDRGGSGFKSANKTGPGQSVRAVDSTEINRSIAQIYKEAAAQQARKSGSEDADREFRDRLMTSLKSANA
tara:strand:- start:769 stop:1203 length:435 start_codon:yes stop_codon:yes gene_type:complete